MGDAENDPRKTALRKLKILVNIFTKHPPICKIALRMSSPLKPSQSRGGLADFILCSRATSSQGHDEYRIAFSFAKCYLT
jgi:hypothetical protein